MGWTCLCSMVNQDDTMICSTCSSIRCGACTSLNNPSVKDNCSVCGSPLPWSCQACTCVNGGQFSTCKVCASPRRKYTNGSGSSSGGGNSNHQFVPAAGPHATPATGIQPLQGSGGGISGGSRGGGYPGANYQSLPRPGQEQPQPLLPRPQPQPQQRPPLVGMFVPGHPGEMPDEPHLVTAPHPAPPPQQQQQPLYGTSPYPGETTLNLVPGSSSTGGDHQPETEKRLDSMMRRKFAVEPAEAPILQGKLVEAPGVSTGGMGKRENTFTFSRAGSFEREGSNLNATTTATHGEGGAAATGVNMRSFLNRKRVEDFDKGALAQVEETRALCRAARSVFVDTLNPQETQLYNWSSVLTNIRPPKPHHQWCVIDPAKGIDTTEILQGELGNCWFLSSIAVLAAHHPELIEHLFITKEMNAEGVFAVKLNIDGKWTPVIIDATFPTLHDNRTLKFAHCPRGSPALWVSLLEKAYAKVNGGYKALVSGHIEDALTDLTGFPCQKIRNCESKRHGGSGGHWDEYEVTALLTSYAEADCVMAASCGGDAQMDAQAKSLGLVTHHAYSILGLAYSRERNEHMIFLRNPWGKSDCKGEAPPTGTTTDNLPQISGPGTFWLSFSVFTQTFQAVVICKTRKYGLDIRVPNVTSSRDFGFVANPDLVASRLTVQMKQPGYIICMASQVDNRREKNRLYYDVGFIVARHNPHAKGGLEPFKILNSSTHRTSDQETLLEEGTYSIFPYSFNCDRGFNVTILSETPSEKCFPVQVTSLNQIARDARFDPAGIVGQLFYGACTNHKKVKVSTMFSDQLTFHSCNLDASYLYAISNTSNRWVTAQIDFKGSHGCSICRSENDNAVGCVNVAVPPRSGMFVCAQVILPNDGAYSVSFSYSISCQMSSSQPAYLPPAQNAAFASFPLF